MGSYKHPRDSAHTVDTVRAQTDSTGKLKFRFVASQFGGVERLFVAAENELPPNNHPWATPHSEHRIGINADIGHKGIDSLGQCLDMIDTTDAKAIIFKKTKIEALNHRPPGPPAPHFHVYVKKY